MPIKEHREFAKQLAYSKISSSYFEHPALSIFNDPRNGSLAAAQIKKWIVMDESKVRNDTKVTILGRLINGTILAEKRFGKGVVRFGEHQLTQIGQIFRARPSYLPFTQQITSFSSESITPKNSRVRLTYNSLSKENEKDPSLA